MTFNISADNFDNDDFSLDENGSGDLVLKHKDSGATFTYDSANGEWVPSTSLNLDFNSLLNVGYMNTGSTLSIESTGGSGTGAISLGDSASGVTALTAHADGHVDVNGGTEYQQRGAPTTSELAAGQCMTYCSDGSDAGAAGDLMYAVNDAGTIKTSVLAAVANAT